MSRELTRSEQAGRETTPAGDHARSADSGGPDASEAAPAAAAQASTAGPAPPDESDHRTSNASQKGSGRGLLTGSGPAGPGGSSSGYPLWVRWTALIIFVAVLGTTFVFLGRWQLSRLHQRRAHNTAIRTAEKAPVASFGAVFDRPITQAQEYRRVKVTGTFDASKQVVIRYRSNGNADGYEVVAPLHTSDGHWLLVDRGFIASKKGNMSGSVPAPPSGQVSITGRARISEPGKDDATVPVHGHARLVNSGKIGHWVGHPVANGYLDAISMHPADSTKFHRIKLPELSDGPHFWYAVQWFMFAGIGATGVVVFIRSDLRERRAGNQPAAHDRPNREPGKPASPASPSPSRAASAAHQPAAKRSEAQEPAPPSSRRLRRSKPQRRVRYGDTQAPPGWKPPTHGK